MTRTRVLFVTWDGPQVQYLENLFLPIFAGLGDHGFDFDVLQFRWGPTEGTERARAACMRHGIGYRSHGVLRRGGGAGAMATALAGARVLRRTARACDSGIVLVRSIMPALMALRAAPIPATIVFDADGLPIDERAEFDGLSTTGPTYRILREIEAQMVRKAAATLTRTAAGAEVLRARAGPGLPADAMYAVQNGSDPVRFAPLSADARASARAELGVGPTTPLLVYVGSIGPQYRLGESISLLGAVRRLHPDARLLILTGTPDLAARHVADRGQADDAGIVIRSCAPDDVARWIAAADVGTAFRQSGYSMAGVSPVKIGEYLLCGTPVVGTAAVGASPAAVEAGVFVDEAIGLDGMARRIVDLQADATRCAANREAARRVGLADYSLDRCIRGYATALRFAMERDIMRVGNR